MLKLKQKILNFLLKNAESFNKKLKECVNLEKEKEKDPGYTFTSSYDGDYQEISGSISVTFKSPTLAAGAIASGAFSDGVYRSYIKRAAKAEEETVLTGLSDLEDIEPVPGDETELLEEEAEIDKIKKNHDNLRVDFEMLKIDNNSMNTALSEMMWKLEEMNAEIEEIKGK